MPNELSYLEFRKSAYRHLNTCECLLKSIENKECTKNKTELIVNTFYLSGYVIECSLKYRFFCVINFKQNDNVYSYKCGKCKGCLKNDECKAWKHHNIDELVNLITDKGYKLSTDVPILVSPITNKKISSLFKIRKDDLDMQIRYSYYNSELTSDLLKDYIAIIRTMCLNILEKNN